MPGSLPKRILHLPTPSDSGVSFGAFIAFKNTGKEQLCSSNVSVYNILRNSWMRGTFYQIFNQQRFGFRFKNMSEYGTEMYRHRSLPHFFVHPTYRNTRTISMFQPFFLVGRRKENGGWQCPHGDTPRNLRCFGILRNHPKCRIPQKKVEPYETLVEHSQSRKPKTDGLVFGESLVVL